MEIIGNAQHILKAKGNDAWTIGPDAWVIDAIRLMGEKNIGALVVTENDEVVGLISERDYSRKIILKGKTSRDTRVGEVISSPVISVLPETPITECMEVMNSERIRHLPVMAEGKLVGVVSIGDVVNWIIRSLHGTVEQLKGYISGQYPG